MNELLRAFDRVGDLAWAVDRRHRIVAWNSAAEDSLGYAASEAVGRKCHELIAGRDLEGSSTCESNCTVMNAACRGRPVRGFDLLTPGCDGKLRHLNVSVVALPEPTTGRFDVLVHIGRLVQEDSVWSPSLRIRLLGPIWVERPNGSVVDGRAWRRAKVRALLAFLALQWGRPVHRDVVIEAMWPNLSYLAALHNLNSTVYNLRRSLEPDLLRGADSRFVRYDGDALFLSGGFAHWLDVSIFETGIAQARRESNPSHAEALYREALALYRGDFLSDLALGLDLRWCWIEQERLRELRLSAMEELGILCERAGRQREATDLYLTVLAADPCRESVCRRLVELLLRAGDHVRAVKYYRRLKDSLNEILSIAPSEALDKLLR